eukprot:scaffold9225_cov66-Attheya_sp.AAC.1
MLKAIRSLCVEGGEVTEERFAAALLLLKPSVLHKYTIQIIVEELKRVGQWYSRSGLFYDSNGNLFQINGVMKEAASNRTKMHMQGRLHPKTLAVFSDSENEQLRSVDAANLLHNSKADRLKLDGIRMPNGKSNMKECTNDELKRMIVVRGGNTTNPQNGGQMCKVEMIKIMQAYQILENHVPSSVGYFNRSKRDNGLFVKIDTSERKTIPQMLSAIDSPEVPDPTIRSFAHKLLGVFKAGKFIDSFDSISDTAPELEPRMIENEFVAVGQSKNSKCLADALTRTQEENERLYHAIAWSEDKKLLYILSKCRASMSTDEKTRPQTGMGERPKRAEYLVILQLLVEPTKVDRDGHSLGRITRIVQGFGTVHAIPPLGRGSAYSKASND